PISQREFYQLFAFFANVNERGVYTETRGNVPPLVKAITPENTKKLAEYDTKIAALSQQLAEHIAGISAHRQEWLDSFAKMPHSKEPEATANIDLHAGFAAHVAITGSTIDAAGTSRKPKQPRPDLFGRVTFFDRKEHLDYPNLNF